MVWIRNTEKCDRQTFFSTRYRYRNLFLVLRWTCPCWPCSIINVLAHRDNAKYDITDLKSLIISLPTTKLVAQFTIPERSFDSGVGTYLMCHWWICIDAYRSNQIKSNQNQNIFILHQHIYDWYMHVKAIYIHDPTVDIYIMVVQWLGFGGVACGGLKWVVFAGKEGRPG